MRFALMALGDGVIIYEALQSNYLQLLELLDLSWRNESIAGRVKIQLGASWCSDAPSIPNLQETS